MRLPYFVPVFMDASGIINLTASQLARLGIDINPADWNAFWRDNEEEITANYPDFDPINNFPAGFDLNDSSTWDGLIFGY